MGRRNLFFAALLFCCFFPYLLSNFSSINKENIEHADDVGIVWVETKHIWGKKRIPLEEYLVGMLAATIPVEYEPETLKAQAILLRSYGLSLMERKNGRKVILDSNLSDSYFTAKQCKKLFGEAYETSLNKLTEAVTQTQGLVLVWEENIVAPPYFRLSNGNTRNIDEYGSYKKLFPYLSSQSCPRDVEAQEYAHYIQMDEKTFQKKISNMLGIKNWQPEKIIVSKDSSNYVKLLQIGKKQIDGEEFRKTMGLPSSSFSMEKSGEYIEFQMKGLGHGFGFSQNTANEMAKEGKTYKELLNFFFPNLSIERI